MVGFDVALGIHMRTASNLLIAKSHVTKEQVSRFVGTLSPVRALNVTVVHRLSAVHSPIDTIAVHRASVNDARGTNEKSFGGNTNHICTTGTVPTGKNIGPFI